MTMTTTLNLFFFLFVFNIVFFVVFELIAWRIDDLRDDPLTNYGSYLKMR